MGECGSAPVAAPGGVVACRRGTVATLLCALGREPASELVLQRFGAEGCCSGPPKKEEGMRVTVSAIKADIGSIGGHLKPSRELLAAVESTVQRAADGLVRDYRLSTTGDDVA